LAGTSEIGSYSRAETQQSILDRNISAICDSLQDTILKQVIKPLLQLNFNEQEDFGAFIETEDLVKDIALNMQKIEMLSNQGIRLKPESIIDLMDLKYDMVLDIQEPEVQKNNKKNNEQSHNDEAINNEAEAKIKNKEEDNSR
jgi:phage gp29-like protein